MKEAVVIIVIGVLLFLSLCSGAFCARGGHFHHGGGPRVFIGGYFGFPYYYPYWYSPYYYPYAYPYVNYPSTAIQAPVYIEPEQPFYWYYCHNPEGYYPYVTSCPGGWTRVVPTPPGKEDTVK